MTAIIITAIICSSLVILCVVNEVGKVADKKNFYNAVAKNPDVLNIKEEDLK